MPIIAVEITNAALTRIGEDPIASFDEGSPHANFANVQYESLVRAQLSYRWNWATTDAALDRIEGTTLSGLTSGTSYAWQLPADMVLLRHLEAEGAAIPFVTRGANRVICGVATGVIAVYVWRPPEDYWPAFFREAITQELVYHFLRSTERWDEARRIRSDLDATWARVRSADSQLRTPRRPWRSLLLEARREGIYG